MKRTGQLTIPQAIVVQITSKERQSHLVAIIRGKFHLLTVTRINLRSLILVPEAEGGHHLESPWFVFNDFVVRNVSEEEALSFPGRWKVSRNSDLECRDVDSLRSQPSFIWNESIRRGRNWISVNFQLI